MQLIVGGRWHQVTLAINLNLDTGFDGIGKVRFSPSERVASALSPLWTVGLEHYSDWGPLAHVPGMSKVQHTVFVVAQETSARQQSKQDLDEAFHPTRTAWSSNSIRPLSCRCSSGPEDRSTVNVK